jgi:hypothetical protein
MRLTFEGVWEFVSKNYNVWLKRKENLHIHDTGHGTVNTRIATNEIPKVFLCISAVKNFDTRYIV